MERSHRRHPPEHAPICPRGNHCAYYGTCHSVGSKWAPKIQTPNGSKMGPRNWYPKPCHHEILIMRSSDPNQEMHHHLGPQNGPTERGTESRERNGSQIPKGEPPRDYAYMEKYGNPDIPKCRPFRGGPNGVQKTPQMRPFACAREPICLGFSNSLF